MTPQRFLTILPAAALIAVASYGCVDDPVAEQTAKPDQIEVNRAETFQVVGGPFSVRASILDPLRTRIPTRLDATTNRPETIRIDSVVYVPEVRETRVFATPLRLDTLGAEITLTGGGLSKSVSVAALPAGIVASLVDVLASGDTAQISVVGLNRDGEPIGPVPFSVTEVDDEDVVSVTAGGEVVGQGVGHATITVTGPGGQITSDVDVEIVPGTFRGTITQVAIGDGGESLVIEAGSVPFDDDTRVLIGGEEPHFIIARSETSITAVVPFGLPAGPTPVTLERIGPDQLALGTTIDLAVVDTFEPNDEPDSAPTITPGTDVYASVDGSDVDDFYLFSVTDGPTTFDIEIDWSGGADVDFFILAPSGELSACSDDFAGCAAASTAHPEAVTDLTLEPGDYLVYVNNYEADGVSTYRLRLTPK